ncbi:hypothetical protein AD938_03145 [Gluconobacter japonicus]|nr:hypothetical protein AD938_03145 [Gluconobacter japonicus]GBR25818.1 hypothetical protein AA3271_2130 [Gluconobacter japonicus NBRC 3271]
MPGDLGSLMVSFFHWYNVRGAAGERSQAGIVLCCLFCRAQVLSVGVDSANTEQLNSETGLTELAA